MLIGTAASGALLAAIVLLLILSLRNDGKEYATFKLLTDTAERQRLFRYWTIKSFLLFSGAALLALLLLGGLEYLLRMPPEFMPVRRWALERIASEDGGGGSGGAFLLLVVGGMLGGAVLGGIASARITKRRGGEIKQVAIGDIEPLFPRNPAERRWTALLGANAGPGEELMFRLVLPLIIAQLTGNPFLAFGIAAAMFGAAHFYQGWTGIAATTVAGLLFTGVYIASGSIWLAVFLHMLMNLNSLWLRPLLQQRFQRALDASHSSIVQ
ncbi:MAG TPA: CPBP family intramembrane glutamic endopeptidase [Allosphingosinicella sp.]|jgi:membrane protease YdiL (CAAX protease family)